MDVNLLPDELKKKEEKELKRRAGEPLEIPMSTPVKELEGKHRVLSVPGAAPSPVVGKEPALPHLREETYIHVDKEGKIVHETPPPPRPLSASIPWWRRLFSFFSRVRVRRVSAPPPKAPPPLPVPPPAPTPPVPKLISPAKVTPSQPARTAGVVMEKTEPSIRPMPAPPPSPPPSPAPPIPPPPVQAKIVTPRIVTERPSPTPPGTISVAPPAPAPPGAPKIAGVKSKGNGRTAGSGLGPPSLGINLLPPEWSWGLSLTLQFRRRVLISLSILLVVSILGSVVGRLVYVARQEKRVAELTTELSDIQSQIDQYEVQNTEWVKLKSRLDIVLALLHRHVMVTPIFKSLEETVRPVVQYTKFSFSGTGKVTVSGVTVSYEDLAKQVLVLEADSTRISNVEIGALNFDKTKHLLTFDLTITFHPEVWHYGSL